jgi:hypothetical protein
MLETFAADFVSSCWLDDDETGGDLAAASSPFVVENEEDAAALVAEPASTAPPVVAPPEECRQESAVVSEEVIRRVEVWIQKKRPTVKVQEEAPDTLVRRDVDTSGLDVWLGIKRDGKVEAEKLKARERRLLASEARPVNATPEEASSLASKADIWLNFSKGSTAKKQPRNKGGPMVRPRGY